MLTAPALYVEGRIGQDVVGLEVREAVVPERVTLLDLAVNTSDGEVHLAEAPGGVVQLLAVNGDIPDTAAVGLDERLRLDEHPARATAGS